MTTLKSPSRRRASCTRSALFHDALTSVFAVDAVDAARDAFWASELDALRLECFVASGYVSTRRGGA